MTAEIAILHREAVAIAADSAATFSDGTSQKIFSSANKIFALSKHHPNSEPNKHYCVNYLNK